MTATLENVYQAALSLGQDERVELADRLLATVAAEEPTTLHPGVEGGIGTARDAARRRRREAVPWSEVKRLAWAAVQLRNR